MNIENDKTWSVYEMNGKWLVTDLNQFLFSDK